MGSAAEQAAHLLGEIFLGERLREEWSSGLEQSTLEHLRSKPGHVEDRLARPALLDMPAQLPTVHSRHFDIREDQMNAAGVLLDGGDGLTAMTRFERLIAGPGQHSAG